jgi:hypothetical protein
LEAKGFEVGVGARSTNRKRQKVYEIPNFIGVRDSFLGF